MCMNSSTLAPRVLVVFGVLRVCGGGWGGLFKVHNQASDGNECLTQLVATGALCDKSQWATRSSRGYPAVLRIVITGVVDC